MPTVETTTTQLKVQRIVAEINQIHEGRLYELNKALHKIQQEECTHELAVFKNCSDGGGGPFGEQEYTYWTLLYCPVCHKHWRANSGEPDYNPHTRYREVQDFIKHLKRCPDNLDVPYGE